MMHYDFGATAQQLEKLGMAAYRAAEKLGADPELLSAFGSLGDTLEVGEVTDLIEEWVKTGSVFAVKLSEDPEEIAAALTNPNVMAALKRRGFRIIPSGSGPDKDGGKRDE